MIVFKIFITLWILNLLFFKRRNGILACGLVGYCGTEPANPWKIRMLQLYNLKRGEHATGIYIGDEVFKDAIPADKFLADRGDVYDLIPEAKNFTIIGHDRQASVGSRDKAELAHPYDVTGKDGKRLILAHNGTIHNIEAIANKFKMDHSATTSSDSWTLTKIMVDLKEEEILELLQGYTGFATLLFTRSTMKNTLFIHRDPERPLFCYQENDHQLYISSIIESLYAIGGTADTVTEFSGHTVYKAVKGRLVKKWSTAERKPILYVSRTSNYNPNAYSRKPSHNKAEFDWEDAYNSYYGRDDIGKKVEITKRPEVQTEGFCYLDGIYMFNGHPYTGNMWINEVTNEWCKEAMDGFQNYFFVRGIMTRSKKDYEELKNKALNAQGAFDVTVFEKKLFRIDTTDHAEYPVKSHMMGVASTPVWFPKKYHSDKYPYGQKGCIKFTPILSNTTYILSKHGVETAKTVDNTRPSVSQRRIITDAKIINISPELTMENAIRTAFKHGTYEDVGKLYISLQTYMGKQDTEELYSSFATTLVNIAEKDGVINKDDVDGILGNLNGGSEMMIHEALTIILGLYNTYLNESGVTDQPLEMEEYINDLRSKNSLFNQAQFIAELDNCQYETLDELLCDYAIDDRDDNTRPVLESVALELNRLSILSSKDLKAIIKLTPAGMHRELTEYYDVYKTIADKVAIEECEPAALECCNAVDLTVGGKIYHFYVEAERLSQKKDKEITDEERALLEQHKQNLLLHLNLADAEAEKYLKTRYGIDLKSIIEEYIPYAGNEER